jgi:ABC-2 type transport system permease protein
MFLVVTLVGLGTVQIRHNGIWGEPHTPDVIAASNTLNLGRDEVADNLQLILDNPEAVTAGANARRIDEDVYVAYLNMMMADPAITTNEMETDAGQQHAMQDSMMAGLEAAAEVLDMDVADLATRMGRIKSNPAALQAMSDASGFPQEMIVGMINQQLASDEMMFDGGIDFSVADYLNLNLGIFLLMFAIAGISFLFSCVFNLTKNSLALGAGIPIAFLIFEIMSGASSDLEFFKFFSLNTLFDPSAITDGGTFIPQFIILAVLGSVLYLIGIKVFKEKDLPL